MREKLPYSFNTPINLGDPISPDQIRRILQEMWQQIVRVVNQQDDPQEPFKSDIANIVHNQVIKIERNTTILVDSDTIINAKGVVDPTILRWTRICYDGNSTTPKELGDTEVRSGSFTAIVPDGTMGPSLEIFTSTTNGSFGWTRGTFQGRVGNNIRFRYKLKAGSAAIPSIASPMLMVIGITDLQTSANISNDPAAANCAFLLYEPAVSANWNAFTKDGTTRSSLSDTGVAVDTNPHVFEVSLTSTNARFYIDEVLKATISTNLPGSGSNLRYFVGVTNGNPSGGVGKAFTIQEIFGMIEV